MRSVATTKMSSKGQVVIPEGIRRRLGIEAGTRFVVMGDKGVVILKTVNPPSMKDFDGLIRQTRKQAKAAGIREKDIRTAVREVRRSV